MDISVNKPMKDELKKRFQAWYASEVQRQLKEVSVDKIKVDVTASAIKAIGVHHGSSLPGRL